MQTRLARAHQKFIWERSNSAKLEKNKASKYLDENSEKFNAAGTWLFSTKMSSPHQQILYFSALQRHLIITISATYTTDPWTYIFYSLRDLRYIVQPAVQWQPQSFHSGWPQASSQAFVSFRNRRINYWNLCQYETQAQQSVLRRIF